MGQTGGVVLSVEREKGRGELPKLNNLFIYLFNLIIYFYLFNKLFKVYKNTVYIYT